MTPRAMARLCCLLALGTLLAAGCRGPAAGDDAGLILRWTIAPSPTRVGPATFAFILTDPATEQHVAGATVRLEGNMSHPGMQPVVATAAEVRPGHYEAALTFTMAGDWFVLVDATLPDGRVVHRQVDVPGVRPR